MLYLAREDEPEHYRGAVVRLKDGVFAPPAEALRFVRLDAPDVDVAAFRVAYLRHLRALWRDDPEAFLRPIERATGGARRRSRKHRALRRERCRRRVPLVQSQAASSESVRCGS